MMKSLATTLTVISMIFPPAVYADGVGKTQYPRTKCNKQLIRDIYDDQNTELMDAVRKYYEEGEKHGMTDAQFCGWLRKKFEGDTTAKFGECQTCQRPEPATPEVDRSFPEPFQREMRRVARPAPPPQEEEPYAERESRGNGGGFMSSPFMGGLMGGLLGGAIGAFLVGRMGQNQHQQPMFPPPPGMLPFPGGQFGGGRGGPPGMLPFPGGQFGGGQFGGIGGMQPFPGQFGGNYGQQYGYGQYGGGYRGPAPSVLPLAPQSTYYSPYSVGGSIPQNHWNLINVGR